MDNNTIRLSRSGKPCAWCLAEHGVKADPKDSHGICVEHLAEIRAAIAKRKAARENRVDERGMTSMENAMFREHGR